MAYIGKTPVIGNFVKLDSITVVNGQAAYTMQNGGVNFTSYDNVNQFLVSLNGVLQAPTDSFTVSGSTLTFASNLSTGDVIDFVLVLGNSLDIGTPSDNTVTAAKIASDAVVTAKINDNAVTSAKMFSTFKNGITMVDMFRLTTQLSSLGSGTFVTSNIERCDETKSGFIGTGMTESSGVFSFPSTGIYLIQFNATFNADSDNRYVNAKIHVTTNNSTYGEDGVSRTSIEYSYGTTYAHALASTTLDVDDTANVKVKFAGEAEGTANLFGSTSSNDTTFTFIRLGDT
jgi:hypothetical protein